jgi:hypothetical protein
VGSEHSQVEQSALTHNLVRVHDCLQAVCDRDDGHVALQLRTEGRLDDRVRLIVDRGSSFVEDQALALPMLQSAHVRCTSVPQPTWRTIARASAMICR